MPHLAVQISKLKDMRGRITAYKARLLDAPSDSLDGRGTTPAMATAALQARLIALPNVTGRIAISRKIGKYVLILCPEADGTREFLIHPDGHVADYSTPETNFDKIESAARVNVAQLMYNPADDTTHGAAFAVLNRIADEREFKTWADWQQRYRKLRLVGYSDVQAHAISSGHPNYPAFDYAMEHVDSLTPAK